MSSAVRQGLALACISLVQLSCCLSSSNLAASSSIPRRNCFNTGSIDDLGDRVRAAILKDCPIGSPEQSVAGYVKKNFRKAPERRTGNMIEFRINDAALFPIARNWLLVRFELGSAGELKDVKVASDAQLWITA